MTFQKPGRPNRYTYPTLPGFGRVGPWSTGVRSKRMADAVEEWLRRMAMTDPITVRGIVEGKYSLRDAYVADKEGRLDALKANLSDPPLRELVDQYEATQSDRRKLNGLSQLRSLAPKGARLSWLSDPKRITILLTEAEAEGRKRNSVHRSLYAAIKGLLAFELGETRKREITADVQYPYEDDTRHVDVTPDQLAALLDACDPQMYDLAVAAILTGVDLSPLLRMTPAHFDLSAGTVRVHDTKNRARHRVLELSSAALAHFSRLVSAAESSHTPIFGFSHKQVQGRWQRVKRDTGLDVRFKDLRHVFSNAWVDAGGSLDSLGGVLGHSRAATTLRYTARQKQEARVRMDDVAERLGLARPPIRLAQGGE